MRGWAILQLLKYMEEVNLSAKSEAERAALLCYYHFKENGQTEFSISSIATWMEECNFNRPNTSRLKEKLTKGKDKSFLLAKTDKSAMVFVPAVLQMMERNYSSLWVDTVTIDSHDELIEEAKFCGKRNYIDRLIKQINLTYGNNCYDACAVLLRRLFEVLLVLTYQNKGIEADISNADGTHKMLDAIVKDSIQNRSLAIPTRISRHFDDFREVGNNSAHSITYTAGKLDIDNIIRDYRVMLEDLYNRAGLM